MALQIINDPYRTFGGGLGATIGQGLSQGLASHLENLAKERLLGIKSKYDIEAAGKELEYKNKIKEAEAEQYAGPLANFFQQAGYKNINPDIIKSGIKSGNLNDILKYGGAGATGEKAYNYEQLLPLVRGDAQKAKLLADLGDRGLQNIALKDELSGIRGQELQNQLNKSLNLGGPAELQEAPSTQQAPTIGGKISPKEVLDIANLTQRAQGQQKAEQRATTALLYPEFEKKVAAGNNAIDYIDTIDDTLDLIKTGKVNLGDILQNKFLPKETMNSETQQVARNLSSLVIKGAQLGSGVATRQRLLAEEAAKPGLHMKPSALINTLRDMRSNPKLLEEAATGLATKKYSDQWGVNIPKNAKEKISNETKKYLKDPNFIKKNRPEIITEGIDIAEIRDKSALPVGAPFFNDKEGQLFWNGSKPVKWQELPDNVKASLWNELPENVKATLQGPK
jgi:hypothetical protein